jgi:hypothetical protein
MQLAARAVLGIALSTAATAAADPACPGDPISTAEAAVRDAQASLDRAEAALAAAQVEVVRMPPTFVPPSPPPVALAADNGPRAGTLAFGVALPTDFTFAPHQTLIGVAGAAFAIDYRLTRRLAIGWTADVELLDTTATADGPYLRTRSGAEARYLFGAAATHAPRVVVFTPWIGVRAGFELLDAETTTRGEYADVSLGWDWWVHHHQFGVYVSLGMAVEPATAYASVTATALSTQPTAMPAAPTVASPYIGVGWRWGFW